MSAQKPRRPVDRLSGELTLRVLRLDYNESVMIRTLSRNYGGLFIHYKGRSYYCPGRDECQHCGRLDQVWKGYAAVEAWDEQGKHWFPWVLEITEALELDFRERYDRGQVWKLTMGPKPEKKGKGSPLRGQLLEERDPDTFPSPFDIRPVLLHIFHVQQIVLDKTNPLPPRVLVQPSQGAPPPNVEGSGEPRFTGTAEQMQALRDRARNFGKMPLNGEHKN